MNVELELAGIKLCIALRQSETIEYFKEFITRESCSDWDIRVEDEDILRYPLICPSGKLDPFSETYLLMPRASAFLLKQKRVLIHGVSFVWREKAWLITAPSGTGKTTQLRHWQDLWGREIELINGDKSVLALEKDGLFWLYPSPWMGKEKDSGNASAELAGIVILEQADKNSIRQLQPRESVLKVFQQFLIFGEDPEEVHAAGQMESQLLEKIPVWLLENTGDKASAQLTYQTLSDYEELTYESF